MPIWQESIQVAENIFYLTDNLPKKEDYGFTSQIRRSALSISANIAEGFGRNHKNDKINFYYYARGSVTETLSHIEYAKRIKYFDGEVCLDLGNRLNKIHLELNKLIVSIKSKK